MVKFIYVAEGVKLLDGYPYVYLEELNALVSADYHFGYEVVLAEEGGYYLPQTQFEVIVGELDKILSSMDIDIFVVNGDLKHKFSMRTRQETREVKDFTEFISDRVRSVFIVRGNHDNFVRGIFNEYDNVSFVDHHLVLGNYLFTHGHILDDLILNALRGRTVFIGHEHPSLLIYDDLGAKIKVPVLLKSKLDFGSDIYVLPACSPLMTGIEMNLTLQEELLSPLFKTYGNLDSSKPYGIVRGKYTLEFPEIAQIREVLSPI